MKKKVLIGVVSSLLVLGGAFAVGASKNDTHPDDSIHLDDKSSSINLGTQSLPEIKEGQEIELETEHGQTFYKIESDDDSSNSTTSQSDTSAISVEEAAKIATNEVNGTVTEVEKEMEHGRMEYKFEIQSNQGEVDVRVDAETGKITRVEFDDDSRVDRDDDKDDKNRVDDKGRGSDDSEIDG
ncbi:PepSY domain-containing protein [Neobacillus sp. 179-C4.2 HS]|uniref:PepSY domain-containing protein n=1 Tax=Neobacillus driksii TaxID=3035913 RepID=A0ABV4YWS7_9BACI|nr:PepSY domain-containing protein [Neobacillus sp. 179.-C4.2 HS]MDP5192246.1 PepSY domain-containing protein [Neobacillus sp. 179.-C4.2 HS]